MDTLSPEILHVVCTFLDIENILRFRMVSRAFAEIGAAYMLPEVSFYMFDGEFERLRAIAAHPIIAKHVRSLTYFAEVMDNEIVPINEFIREHRRNQVNNMANFLRTDSLNERLTLPQIQRAYKEYENIMKKQEKILDSHTDVECLKEVIPKFTNLRQATMSSGHEFYEGRRDVRKIRDSPFKLSPLWPGSDLQPEGKRHLNSLIAALISSNCQLESFRAGVIDWKFFKNFTDIPDKLTDTLKYLKRIELAIDADPQENVSSIARCRRVMETGIIRKLLKPLEHLEVLHVTLYPVEWAEEEWPAAMEDIIAANHKWPNLKELVLGGFITNRHDLMRFLVEHKGTLKRLCLRDLSIGETSWWNFLPEIRNQLNLEDSCICGDIVGNSEDDSQMVPTEYWDLSTPDVCRDKLRESINAYCRGSGSYPDEIPLKSGVVAKNWSQYVSTGGDSDGSFEDVDDDDEDEDDEMEPDWDEDYLDEFDGYDEGMEDMDMLAQMMFFGGGGPMMGFEGFGEVDEFGDEWEEEDDDDNSVPDPNNVDVA